mgnify:CR=1 FL=1
MGQVLAQGGRGCGSKEISPFGEILLGPPNVVAQSNLRPMEPTWMNYEPLLAGLLLTLYHPLLEEITLELPKEAVYKA